jgi:hypothetical protein
MAVAYVKVLPFLLAERIEVNHENGVHGSDSNGILQRHTNHFD